MVAKLEQWARVKRTAMQEDLRNLKAGGKVLSPSGDDITDQAIDRLMAHLEHVNLAIAETEDSERS